MISKPALQTLSAAVLSLSGLVATAQMPVPVNVPTAKIAATYGQPPLQFEVNQGQTDPRVKMLAHGQGYNILLQPTVATFDLHKASKAGEHSREVVSLSFVGASKSASLAAEQKLPGYVNYMHGSDSSKWQTGVPTFARARAAAIYPGVDVVFYGAGRQLEFDMVVAAGANPDAVRLGITGAKPVLEGNGELVLAASADVRTEDVRLRKPVLYQMAGSRRELVDGAFTVTKNGEIGFRIGSYDHTRELVIDPILSYASYFGGTAEDEINGSAINAAGQLYAVGQTFSIDLPGTSGEYDPSNLVATTSGGNGHMGFVTKFSANGTSVLWTTYLGGDLETRALAVAVSAADQAYVTGVTGSSGPSYFQSGVTYSITDFPVTTNAVQPLGCPAGANAQGVQGFGNYTQEVSGDCGGTVFVSRLSADGKSLIYSTFLGGGSNYQDVGTAIALDATNNIYLAGYINSTGYEYAVSSNLSDVPSYPVNQHGVPAFGSSDFPTTPNAYQSAFAVAKAQAEAAGPDGSGNLGALGNQHSFVTEISADGSKLIYSSAIGNCPNNSCHEYASTVAPGPNGLIYVGGVTQSNSFPVTTGAFAPTCTPQSNGLCAATGWLTAFDTTKSGAASLAFSTYITGTVDGADPNGNPIAPYSQVNAVTTDASQNVIVTGQTDACNFPTTTGTIGAASKPHGDGNGDTNVCATQGFITKLTPAGATVWSTYLEGTGNGTGNGTSPNGVAVDAASNVYVLATTDDNTLPLKNAIYPPNGQDGYLIEISPDAKDVLMGTFIGTSGPGGPALSSNSLSLDSNATAYISGSAGCGNYGCRIIPATTGAFLTSSAGGNSDGWVMKIITQQQPSATALTVNPATTAKPTDTITLTATVTTTSTLTGSILPTGTVTFLNGATAIGTATLSAKGMATYTGMLPTGTYNITASYAGDTGFNSSVSPASSTLTVTSATATTTALTVAPASVPYGTASTLTATVMAGTAPATAGAVTFTAGSVALGSANVNTNGVATLSATPAVGIYSVEANYAGTVSPTSGTGFAPSTSTGAALTVTKAATTTALTSSTATAGTGMNITLTATISGGAMGATAPGGVVTFLNGTTSLGTGTATAGVATLVTSFSSAATYNLTAVYPGDLNYMGSTSPLLSQAVVTPSFTVVANPASLTIARGSSGSTTLTFTPVGGYSGVVALSCGTLPSKAACTFTPASVTLAGSPVTSSLTISTGSLTALLTRPTLQQTHHSEVVSAGMATLPAILLGWLVCYRRKRFNKWIRLTTLLLAVSVGLMAGGITGCSSSPGSSGANATPAGSYSVPLSFTGPQGTLQTLTLSVTVQ